MTFSFPYFDYFLLMSYYSLFKNSKSVYRELNQSAEGAGGLGIIRGNKVGESE